jgi:hypothetical protein
MTDRLAEAEQLIIDTQQVNEHGFPIPSRMMQGSLILSKCFNYFIGLLPISRSLKLDD